MAILVVSHDVVGKQMAGPGIRYYQLARVLSSIVDVTLAVPNPPDETLSSTSIHLAQYSRDNWASLERLIPGSAAVVLNCVSIGDFPELAKVDVPIVVDGYDPLLAEWLSMTEAKPEEQDAWWGAMLRKLTLPYLVGDFFICASERQRDWWLGLLEANGRINPWNYRQDPTFRKLVDVVPFGLPGEKPLRTHPVVRGVWKGVNEGDKVILWGGGLWPWMDPITAIQAIGKVWLHRQDIRLIFPGTRHPNPVMAQAPTHLEAARQAASQLGLLDKAVFFGDWVAYPDWPDVLLESDLALSLHTEGTLETRWAFRTRVLDTIWAGLPIVASGGDATSDLITSYAIGSLVGSQDVDGTAQAILTLLDRPPQDFSGGFEAARQALTWEKVAQPLINFVGNPHPAPDKLVNKLNIGNVLYTEEINRLEKDNSTLRGLVNQYEQRRIIRWSNRLKELLK